MEGQVEAQQIEGMVADLGRRERQVQSQLQEREYLKASIQEMRLAITHARKRKDALWNNHRRLERCTAELRSRTKRQQEKNFLLWRKMDQNGLDVERLDSQLQHYRLETAVLEQEVELEQNAVETVEELRQEATRILAEKQYALEGRQRDVHLLHREQHQAGVRLETARRKKELVHAMVQQYLGTHSHPQ